MPSDKGYVATSSLRFRNTHVALANLTNSKVTGSNKILMKWGIGHLKNIDWKGAAVLKLL
jgi:hypothetical protein